MPEGIVHWYDPVRGDAEILRDGHPYVAPPGAVEAPARHPGARVRFDVHEVDGIEQAVDVRLRPSAWASRHRHRFGTMTGARYFDQKGRPSFAGPHPELRPGQRHPLQVARSWATSLAAGDVDGALSLYAPVATLHAADRSVAGLSALRRWLESAPALGCRRHAHVHGHDEEAVVSWEADGPGEPGFTVRSRIDHGEITEQWELEAGADVGVPAAAVGEPAPTVVVHTDGDVERAAAEQARQVVAHALDRVGEPVLLARVKLRREPDPARSRPAVAEVLLDVNGDLVRAHAAGGTMAEAVDAVDRRLRDRLRHRASRRDRLHRADAVAAPGEWRHADLPAERPGYFDRPPEERQLLRHKTFAVDELTVDEAVFDMEQLDYDFYLFVDVASGLDAMVERRADGTYRMTRLRRSAAPLGPVAEPVTLSDEEVPVLGLREAIERVGTGGEDHLFFADEGTGRGCVLYHRYDGHYGVITPG